MTTGWNPEWNVSDQFKHVGVLDMIQKLREELATAKGFNEVYQQTHNEMKEERTQLKQENEQLREALKSVRNEVFNEYVPVKLSAQINRIVDKALSTESKQLKDPAIYNSMFNLDREETK
jgi:uncharacterized protein involved in exopolysaccharide biosynthesis